ncbi:MAG: ATP-binding cassette domain-containing protein [Desulfuromonadales bacterium]|nr:ATP-binding cassette domain-containing protein [Desulfuromonadales bacterium]
MDYIKQDITVENVTVIQKDSDGNEIKIIDNVSVTVRNGEISVITGPSGSGKSTLLRVINRLQESASGKIFLGDQDIKSINPLTLRRKVVMILQKPFMFEGTLLSNLQIPFTYQKTALPEANSKDIERALELTNIPPEMLNRSARSLSGGEQQRLNLARALILKPEALLLDEPTSALDRPATKRIAAMLRNICVSEKVTIVLVTHDLFFAEAVADRIIYMEHGKVIEEGTAKEIFSNPKTAEFKKFLEEPEKVKE